MGSTKLLWYTSVGLFGVVEDVQMKWLNSIYISNKVIRRCCKYNRHVSGALV